MLTAREPQQRLECGVHQPAFFRSSGSFKHGRWAPRPRMGASPQFMYADGRLTHAAGRLRPAIRVVVALATVQW